MRTRRITFLALLPAIVALSACSLLPAPTQDAEEPSLAAPPAAGTCLAASNGSDADLTSVVECTEPHVYDIVDTAEFPGMDDAIAESDAATVWAQLHNAGGVSVAYYEWAFETCDAAVRSAVGWDDVTVGDQTAADLWLLPGGRFGTDQSLGSQESFVAGAHETVCSAVWYDDSGLSPVAYPAGVDLGDALTAEFPLEARECWGENLAILPCTSDHAAQVLLGAHGVPALGEDVVLAIAGGTAGASETSAANAFCAEAVGSALPQIDLSGLELHGVPWGGNWSEFTGTLDEHGAYFLKCLVTAADGSRLTGDAFAGTALA